MQEIVECWVNEPKKEEEEEEEKEKDITNVFFFSWNVFTKSWEYTRLSGWVIKLRYINYSRSGH